MARYIDAELAEAAMQKLENDDFELYGGVNIPEGFDGSRAISALREIPAADVEEVRRGKWETFHVDAPPHSFKMIKCTFCKFFIPTLYLDITKYNYCPNCGAKMDGGKE